jgi:hypothetical protein
LDLAILWMLAKILRDTSAKYLKKLRKMFPFLYVNMMFVVFCLLLFSNSLQSFSSTLFSLCGLHNVLSIYLFSKNILFVLYISLLLTSSKVD